MLRFIPLFVIFGCSSDKGVKVYNSPPSASIISHAENVELSDNVLIDFAGIVSDGNDGSDSLTVTWSTDQGKLCEEAPIDDEGITTCTTTLLPSDTQLILQATDPAGETAIDNISIIVIETEPPSLQVHSPEAYSTHYSDIPILFSMTIEDAEDSISELTYTLVSDIDGSIELESTPNNTGYLESYIRLQQGEHVLTVDLVDSDQKTFSQQIPITVNETNTPPNCQLDEPNHDTSFLKEESISFSGSATDIDIDNEDLILYIESNLDGILLTEAPSFDGSFSYPINTLQAGFHSITLRVEDEVGATCSDTIQIAVGTPPEIDVQLPLDNDVYTLNHPIFFVATVTDQEDALDVPTVVWNSDIDGDFWTQSSDLNGDVNFEISNLTAGVHQIHVTVTDSMGFSVENERTIRVNTPPTMPNITISPSEIYTTDTITVTATDSTDADGDNVFYTYSWMNQNTTTNNTTNTLSPSETTVGENWSVTVIPNDNDTTGTPATIEFEIQNSAPTIDTPTIIPAEPTNDETVTCQTQASDADEELSILYNWEVNGITYEGSQLDLSLTNVLPFETVKCIASVTDSYGITASDETETTIINRLPVIASVTIEPAEVYANSDVTCSIDFDEPDNETITPSYNWLSQGNIISTSQTFTLDPNQIQFGNEIECQASVVDSSETVVDLTQSVEVMNASPIITDVSLDPTNPTIDAILVCTAEATDLDDENLSYTFSWTNSSTEELYVGTDQSTSSTLVLSDTAPNPNEGIKCDVTVIDEYGNVVQDYTETTVANSPPYFTQSAEITPVENIQHDTLLTCTAEGNDLNDSSIAVDYEWTIEGVSISTEQEIMVDTTNMPVGSEIVCTATIQDTHNSIAQSEDQVIIQNTPPSIIDINIVNVSGDDATYYNSDTIECAATVLDPEESLEANIVWMHHDVQIGQDSILNLQGTTVLPLDMVTCVASATDSHMAEAEPIDISIAISNRFIEAPAVEILPQNPIYNQDSLECSHVLVEDIDGQDVSYAYQWYINDELSAFTSAVVDISEVEPYKKYVCELSITDSIENSTSISTSVTTTSACTFGLCDENMIIDDQESIDLVILDSGSFTMGSPENEVGRNADETTFQATLSDDFFMATTEISQGMFSALMGYDARQTQSTSFGDGDNFPAYFVNWNMAADFANKFTDLYNEKHGTTLEQCYSCTGSSIGVVCESSIDVVYQCTGFRLPTEMEWEYAARAGTNSSYWTELGGGDLPSSFNNQTYTLSDGSDLRNFAWYFPTNSTPFGSKEIATLTPNGFNLYDMLGNISEWTHDSYDTYPISEATDYTANLSSNRVLRGGAWNVSPNDIRSASRVSASSNLRSLQTGFRIVRTDNLWKPTAPLVSLDPMEPIEQLSDIQCIIEQDSISYNGAVLSYNIDWMHNDLPYTGGTTDNIYSGDTIPASQLEIGDTWTCIVTPTDGNILGYSGTVSATVLSPCTLTECDYGVYLAENISVDFVEISDSDLIDPKGRYTIPYDFFIMTTEVTQGAFYHLMNYDPLENRAIKGLGDDVPIYHVNWHMAADFANHLTTFVNNQKGTSLNHCYICSDEGTINATCTQNLTPDTCDGFMLPTEVEWELSARSNSSKDIWTGYGNNLGGGYSSNQCSTSVQVNDFVVNPYLSDYAWFCGNSSEAQPVATLLANGFGIYDMYGNLWEWTNDWFGCSYPAEDLFCDENSGYKVRRGGAWSSAPAYLRTSYRNAQRPPTDIDTKIGFRLRKLSP